MSEPPRSVLAMRAVHASAMRGSEALRTIESLARDSAVRRHFTARAAATDLLDAWQSLAPEPAVREAAASLLHELDAADARFLSRVRERIRHGRYTPSGLRRGLARHSAPQHSGPSAYDALDVLLSGLLDAGELPVEQITRGAEMVAYQPTPGRIILSLAAQVQREDVFYDLGAGLGRVVIMVALLCGVRAIGVELEPGFCAYAERAASAVAARGVRIITADARDAPLAEGTIFFLYTPFRGELLRRVLSRLRAAAQHRPIRVCTFGPCTAEVAQEPWLQLCAGVLDPHELAVFKA